MIIPDMPEIPRGPTKKSVILFIAAVVSVVILVAGGTAFAIWNSTHHSDVVAGRQQKELQASCSFWYQLGTAPVTPIPPVTRPSKLGISIVVGSRFAYAGENCGTLPVPSPELEKWAAYYNLSLPG